MFFTGVVTAIMRQEEFMRALQRARSRERNAYEKYKAEQDARSARGKLQQDIDDEGCGAVFAAIDPNA